MGSPNLAIAHIAAAQNQPEVTANDAVDALDNSINLKVSIALTDADTTLTQAQLASGGVLKFTGTLSTNRHLNLPASIGRLFIIINATTGGFNLIVQVIGAPGTTVTVPASATALLLLYSDGTNVSQASSSSGGGGSGNNAYAETPSGSIDGTNTSFTLAHAPNPSTALMYYLNGLLLKQGVDYTLSSTAITMTAAPLSGDVPQAFYPY